MIIAMRNDDPDQSPELAALYAAHIETICRRFDHALERAGGAYAVVFSGSHKTAFLDDRTYPFVANPHFLSWAPLVDMPLSYIVYSPGAMPILIYYQPEDYWHAAPGMPEGFWAKQFDIRVVHAVEEIGKHLPTDKEKCILIGEADDAAHAFDIERINPTTAINILHYARGVKTEYEVACMRLASQRAVRGHRAAETAFRDGQPEFEIHRAYCLAVRHTDNELPYENIVALNDHGAVLHYNNLDRRSPAVRRSFLIDAGARVHGYAADITRTYAYEDTRFAELIGRMDKMQQHIVRLVKAGINYSGLHLAAHRLLAGVLVDAGLAAGDPDTLLATGVTSAFFPHGLGHLIGIQVHDVGGHLQDESGTTSDPPSGHAFLRLTRVLQEDMVVTIEPGLYAIDMLLQNLRGTPAEQHVKWDGVEWLRPFGGIRIEDNVRVTADGSENLTRIAFAAVA